MYDEVGNPLTIGSKELSWLGRQLTQITDGEEEISYAYNGDGQRISKTVNGTTTQFAYLGGRLMAQKTGEDVLFFQYGAGGVPLGFVLNGVQYFYITNQLGDIIGITDATGKAIVEYSYDEWGSPIQTITRDNTAEQNKIAEINPLRYRGYYYDTETKPLLQPRMGQIHLSRQFQLHRQFYPPWFQCLYLLCKQSCYVYRSYGNGKRSDLNPTG